jgi:hypothetical protein
MKNIPADLRLYYLQRSPPVLSEGIKVHSYFPSLEALFPSIADQAAGSPTLASKELVSSVNLAEGTAEVEDLVTHAKRTTPIWIRQVHLMEPTEVMSGEYVTPEDGALPHFRGAWQRSLRKINDPYNEAYTDAVFACMASRLVETGRSPHFCRFYGTYNGRTPEYCYNISDFMGDIEGEPWFAEGLRTGAFRIMAVDPYDPDVMAPLTEPWEDVRPKLAAAAGEDESITGSEGSSSVSAGSTRSSLSELEEADIEVSGAAEVVRPRVRLNRVEADGSAHSDDEEGGDDETDSDVSEDDLEYKVYLKNFPVQMSVLEKCDGTMDALMEDEISDEATADMKDTKEQRWTAWMFQVIAGLAVAQQSYEFVHNDLHTNNIMWCGTGETHLYYHVTGGQGGDRYYKVPTYGRIMKIIDFGRATFRPPVVGGAPIWIPDAYAPGGDADKQYNFGQYFDQSRPKLEPNKSFDLSRLAVAMLETLWPTAPEPIDGKRVLTREPGRVTHETVSPLWNLLWIWLTDKHGKNILRTPTGEERYPNFDMYCAIARDVNNAVPAQQLTLPIFDTAFRCRRKDIPADATIWKLTASQRC